MTPGESTSVFVALFASAIAFITSVVGAVQRALGQVWQVGDAAPLVARVADAPPTTSTSGLIAVGALVTAIGGALFPYWKAWLERSDLKRQIEQLRRDFEQERDEATRKEQAMLALMGQMRTVIHANREWMRSAHARFDVPLPEGFADRPFDRLISFDPDDTAEYPTRPPGPRPPSEDQP